MNVKLELVNPSDFSERKIQSKEVPAGCRVNMTPRIYMSELARTKMHAMAAFTYNEVGAYEVFAYLLGEEMGKALDLIIPHVDVTGGYGEVTSENIKKVQPEINEINRKRAEKNEEREKRNKKARIENEKIQKRNEKIRRENEKRKKRGLDLLPEKEELPLLRELKPLAIIGWTHSHVNMHVFSSMTDDRQHDTLHRELALTKLLDQVYDATEPKMFYIIGITVNIHGDEYGVVRGSLICGLDLKWEDVEISPLDDDEYTRDEIRDQLVLLKEDVKSKVHMLRERVKPGPRFIMPSHSPKQEASTGNAGQSSFDKYIATRRRYFEPSCSSAIDSMRENMPIEKLFEDEKIDESLVHLKKIYKKKPKTFELVLKTCKTIMTRARDIMIDRMERILTGDDEEDEENVDECTNCGVVLDDCNYKGDQDGDGNPVCTTCARELENDMEDDEKNNDDASLFNYFDDDGNPSRCFKCYKKLVAGLNFDEEYDENGFPTCSACSGEKKGTRPKVDNTPGYFS